MSEQWIELGYQVDERNTEHYARLRKRDSGNEGPDHRTESDVVISAPLGVSI